MKPWVKWSLIAFVALIVFGAIFGKDEPKNATTANTEPNKAVVEPVSEKPKVDEIAKDANGNIIDSKLQVGLLNVCEAAVKQGMTDPNSLKTELFSIKAWESPKGYKIGFKFDGKNGFGGTVNHTAVCEISKDKKLLAVSVE